MKFMLSSYPKNYTFLQEAVGVPHTFTGAIPSSLEPTSRPYAANTVGDDKHNSKLLESFLFK